MRSRLLRSALLGAAALGALSLAGTGVALAGPGDFSSLTGNTYSVTVYTGAAVQHDATAPPSSATTGVSDWATFIYTGPINFVNNNTAIGANTFSNFGLSTSNILGFSGHGGFSTEGGFLSSTMSTSGYGTTTYMTFSGTYTAAGGTLLSISHDDGASFYTNGSTTPDFGTKASPTTEVTDTGLIAPTGSGINFTLAYVEANGAPSVLVATVPEPGSLALLGTGLLGLGLVARRRRRRKA